LHGSDRLQALLDRLDLIEYADIFRKEKIDDGNLHLLTEGYLREINIPLGPALQILDALKDWRPTPGGSLLPLPPSVGVQFATSGDLRQITVLYCDLVQSTELTRLLGYERYATFFAEYLSTCAQIVAQYDQEISELKGDGIGVYFGLRKAREDDADQAVRAAIEISQAVSKIPTTEESNASCRIGIATGAVAVMSSQVFGDVMNLASRLQHLGAPGDVIVEDSTRRICGDAFEFIDLGYRDLKGLGAQRVWRLGGYIPGISRFEAITKRRLSPLTGRDEELRALRDCWHLASEGSPQVIRIEGDAGIGKSRLVRELMDEVASHHSVIHYQCMLRRQTAAYHPLIEQLERMSGIRRNRSASENLEKLRHLSSAWGISDDNSVQALAVLLGLAESAADGTLTGAEFSDQIVRVFTTQLKSLSSRQPVLIVFEDVHWVDPSTADLLTKLISFIRAEALPVLVMLTHRPIMKDDADGPKMLMACLTSEADANHDKCGSPTTLRLKALKRHESFAIIKHVAKSRQLGSGLLESIAIRADDVPLFVEEVTNYVLEFGKLHDLDEHQPVLLERIRPYLTGRLDGLGMAVKEVAQVGSVIGRSFTALLVSRGLDCDSDSLQPRLDQLVQSELVHKQGNGPDAVYSFKHVLVQDTIYASLFQKHKRIFHRRIAEALEREFPETVASEPDVLAWHFTEADESLKAITYWSRAGEAAISRSAMREARRQFEHGENLINKLSKVRASLASQDSATLDSLELELLGGLGATLWALEGSSDQSLVTRYKRVLDLASKQGRPDREFDAHLALTNHYYVAGRITEAESHIRPCLSLAESSQDSDQLVSAHRIMGELAFYLGDLDCAIEHLSRAIEHYHVERQSALVLKLGDDPGILARPYLALSLWLKGEVGNAFKQCNEGIAEAEKFGHEFTLTQANFDTAWLHAIARSFESAKMFASKSIELCSNSKDEFRLYLGCASVLRGWVMTLEGNTTQGIKCIKQGMPLIEDTDAGICLGCFLPWLAEGLGHAGEIEEGLKVIRNAQETATDHFYDAERLRIEGQLRTHIDRDGARRCFQAAIDVGRKASMKSLELRAALALHDFQLSQDEKVDIGGLFGHLRPWIEGEVQNAEMRRARKLLVE
jgi:class 3 adenylate cyclase/tetratricopeptide (TPR) repeat protein/ABC-type transport system involved in cytochrome c biogenesis ATPase subunit